MAQLMNHAVHVRINGRSEECTLAMLNLSSTATDEQLKQAITGHLDLSVGSLANHVVVRTSQAIIVRPEAIYG
ncbi:MAG TPA: hypothetical protein VFN23_06905 [Ktedonobacteraceae bacterium]|nr:hypothetical protein [Ktedonobacteraceae bacterium]